MAFGEVSKTRPGALRADQGIEHPRSLPLRPPFVTTGPPRWGHPAGPPSAMRVHDRVHGDLRRPAQSARRCPASADRRGPRQPGEDPSSLRPTSAPCPSPQSGSRSEMASEAGVSRWSSSMPSTLAGCACREVAFASGSIRLALRASTTRRRSCSGSAAAGVQPARPHLGGRPGDLRHRGRPRGGRVPHRRRLARPRPPRPRSSSGRSRRTSRSGPTARSTSSPRPAMSGLVPDVPESRSRGAIRPPDTGRRVLS